MLLIVDDEHSLVLSIMLLGTGTVRYLR